MPIAATPLTLAPGDLITKDYQYEYNGLLIGAGTSFVTEKVSGLLGHPDMVQYHTKSLSRHGLDYSYESLDARHIVMDVAIEADNGPTVELLLDDFASAFQVSKPFQSLLVTPLSGAVIDLPFVVQRPNKVKRCCYGHTIKRDFDSVGDVASGLAKGSLELLCGDPRVYSLAQASLASNIAGGASSSPTLIAANNGKFPSPRVTLTFTGPGTNPFITNVTTGRAIRTNTVLSPGDVLTIDLYRKTILKNGVNDYSIRRADSQWWELLPGNNQIVFSRQSTDATNAPVTIAWQDAWSSA